MLALVIFFLRVKCKCPIYQKINYEEDGSRKQKTLCFFVNTTVLDYSAFSSPYNTPIIANGACGTLYIPW